MIRRLVIHRFRGIREGVLDDLGKINLLIGPNNSGKTAILEMLYLGGSSSRPISLILDDVPLQEGEEVTFPATTSARWDFLRMEPFPRLRLRHGYKGERLASQAVVTNEGGLEFNLAALSDYRGPLKTFRMGAPLPEWGAKDRLRFFKKDAGRIAVFTIEPSQAGIPEAMLPTLFSEKGVRSESDRLHYLWEPSWVYQGHREEPIDSLAIWAERGTLPTAHHVLFFDFHTANNHFTPGFAQWAKNQRWDWTGKIQEHLERVFPDMKIARVEIDDAPDGQKSEAGYIRTSDGKLIVDHFGDGARHAFKVLAGLIALCETVDDEHPGLFLWEDPELFMHPATLGRLLDEVMALVGEKSIQIFLTTQSLEVLAWLVKYLDHAPTEEAKEVRTFYLDLRSGVLRTRRFTGRGIGSWFRLFGDPRLSGEEEMTSPLHYLIEGREA